MTAALTPERALEYLATLSTDIRASAVLGPGDALLAGDPALAATAAAALGRSPGEDLVRELLPSGVTLTAARSSSHAVAVETGPHALPALVAMDLRNVLGDLDGEAASSVRDAR
jgi:hypothetical protein